MLEKPGVRPWRLGVGTNALEQESWIYVDISLLARKNVPMWPVCYYSTKPQATIRSCVVKQGALQCIRLQWQVAQAA